MNSDVDEDMFSGSQSGKLKSMDTGLVASGLGVVGNLDPFTYDQA